VTPRLCEIGGMASSVSVLLIAIRRAMKMRSGSARLATT
jgi:hypothetical protein